MILILFVGRYAENVRHFAIVTFFVTTAEILIQITLFVGVIKLPLFCRLLSEIPFELRIGTDNERRPVEEFFIISPESRNDLSRRLKVKQPFAVGGIGN